LLIRRNRESGTFEFFTTHTLASGETLAPDTRYITESHEVSLAVARDRDAIGFVGLPYVGESKALKLIAIDQAAFPATKLNVYREDYPLSRRLYLYTPSSSANPAAQDFVAFTMSPEGQQIVEDIGFVGQAVAPVSGRQAARQLPSNAPTS
jgi:phosphate transport system substrate-binding protein